MAETDNVFEILEPLNVQERAFVAEYLVDENATQAALRAGYSPSYAKTASQVLLKRPSIIAAIENSRAQRLVRTQIKSDDVLLEMSLLAQSSIEHYVIDDDGEVTLAPGAPAGAMKAIQSIKKRTSVRRDPKSDSVTTTVEVELKLWDKPTPLKLMGRHAGLFPDRMEHTGKGGGPIETVTRVERVIVDPDSKTA